MARRRPVRTAEIMETLAPLLTTPSVSGGEGAFAALLAEAAAAAGAEVTVDPSGNVLARKGPAPRLAVMCHMDTVGWMVARRTEDNARLSAVGGIAPGKQQRCLLSTASGGAVPGIVLTRKEGADPVFEPLDPGALKDIRVGDRVSYALEYELAGDRLQGPYLDNRLGCWMGLELLRDAQELLLIGTVQEETTCMGAHHARAALAGVEEVLILDVTYADSHGEEYPIRLGGGPVLGIKDEVIPAAAALERVQASAARAGVELQLEVADAGGTDALALARWDRPILFAFFGIPSRYNHQPTEVVDLGDLEAAMEVLRAWVAPSGSRKGRGTSTKARNRRRKT